MPNRTEMLHFRATPEEKEAIRENAGFAELALSEWMRQRSLGPFWPGNAASAVPANEVRGILKQHDKFMEGSAAREVFGGETYECCGGPNETGKHLEGCPHVVQEEAEASYHDKRLERRLKEDPEFRAEFERERAAMAGETYEQFMERRVGELIGESGTSDWPAAEEQAEEAANAEWVARGPE